jgi:hypothetical protein
MAVPTYAEFIARFPEFGEQPEALVTTVIEEAADATPELTWGSALLRTRGIRYLTAHILATRTMQIGAQVDSPSGAPLGINLDATLYGQEYKRVRDNLPFCGFTF